jgi:DNA-binding SARP family transcriptional activator
LEAFWPGVDPRVSRNRLQVAISSVRRSLGEVSNSALIVYSDGRYLVDQRSAITTDVDRFEAATRDGRNAEREGDVSGARAHYLEAVGLYRGDFAPDLPYDEWTILIRERLRLAYLDVLERCARISMAADEIDDCIDIARRMLDQDACREDAHRVLMRCYSRQGKPHLVDYQYDFCVRVLDGVLRTRPSKETIATHREERSVGGR